MVLYIVCGLKIVDSKGIFEGEIDKEHKWVWQLKQGVEITPFLSLFIALLVIGSRDFWSLGSNFIYRRLGVKSKGVVTYLYGIFTHNIPLDGRPTIVDRCP